MVDAQSDSLSLARVWWWNNGAYAVLVPQEAVGEIVNGLRADGFYCWVTRGVPIEQSCKPPPGS